MHTEAKAVVSSGSREEMDPAVENLADPWFSDVARCAVDVLMPFVR